MGLIWSDIRSSVLREDETSFALRCVLEPISYHKRALGIPVIRVRVVNQ